MLNMGLIGVIIVIVVALLNIILFVKVWGMTNNTKKILLFLQAQRPDLEYKEETDSNYAHYGERVQEKKD
jgi:hypothetical protein